MATTPTPPADDASAPRPSSAQGRTTPPSAAPASHGGDPQGAIRPARRPSPGLVAAVLAVIVVALALAGYFGVGLLMG